MIDFKDFYKMPKLKVPEKKKELSEMKARHLHPIGRDPISHKKHPGRFVPKMHQTIVENPKLKRIKQGKSKQEYLHRADLKDICDTYKVRPNMYKDRKLGNTGVILTYDHVKEKFKLIKV